MKFRKYLFAATVMFTMIFFIHPLSTQAANPTAKRLQEGVIYSTYDITGDGRADKILVQNTHGTWHDGVRITINGKVAYNFFNDGYYITAPAEATLYTLKNGKPFLYLFAYTEDDDGLAVLLQYSAGKLKKIIDFNEAFSYYGMHRNGRVVNVNGNNMTLGFTFMSWTLGFSQYNFTYTYRGGTMKMANRFATVSRFGSGNTLIAARTLRAYTNVWDRKTSFILKPGNKVTVKKLYYGNGVWLQLYYGKKIGYIKCLSSYPANGTPIFSNVMYAG